MRSACGREEQRLQKESVSSVHGIKGQEPLRVRSRGPSSGPSFSTPWRPFNIPVGGSDTRLTECAHLCVQAW